MGLEEIKLERFYVAGLGADPFGSTSRAAYKHREAFFKQELPRLFPNGTVPRWLDICCATGDVTALFAQYADEIVGVDGVESFLTVARKRHPDIEYIKREFLNEVRLELPGTFDVISIIDSIYLFSPETQVKLLEACCNLLSPDGFIIVDKIEDEILSRLQPSCETNLTFTLSVPKKSLNRLSYLKERWQTLSNIIAHRTDSRVLSFATRHKLYSVLIRAPLLAKVMLLLTGPIVAVCVPLYGSLTLHRIMLYMFGGKSVTFRILKRVTQNPN